MRIANIVKNNGLPATILTRYCISNKSFMDLENLLGYDQWVRSAGRNEGDEYHSWLEEWLEEHQVDFFDEDDPDNETENE